MTVHALLDFHLLTPVMVTGPGGGDPNSEITLPYLPGSAIRGAFVAKYDGTKLASDRDFHRLFLSGSVRYLNGYLVQEDVRCLPTPASWQMIKDADLDNDVTIFDQAVQPYPGDETLKSLSETFLIDGEKRFPIQPERHVAIHIARESRQRPTDPGSTVFRYDSLAAGQTFRAVVLADDPADLKTLQDSLADDDEITMGRSHRAGYGLVRVSWLDVDESVRWQEYTPAMEPASDRLIVTLLSDCLIRNPESGSYTSDLLPLLPLKADEVIDAFVSIRVVGGFNRKWNLPLPQGLAIAAGSVFVYPFSDALAGKLAELEVTGLGERTAEGFGRIAVNWHQEAEFNLSKVDEGKIEFDPNAGENLEGEARRLAVTMVQRLTEERLERTLAERLSGLKIETDSTKPSNSQLARLRIVVKQDLRAAREAKAQGSEHSALSHLGEYLAKDRLRKPARDQLQKARIDNGSLLVWLQKLVEDPQQVWQTLDFDSNHLSKIGPIQAHLTDADAVYYGARLIDAVCRQAAKTGLASEPVEPKKEGGDD